ncbi:MAG: exosortase-associated EpsI family protein [Chlamydiales bacterium]|nr:exosortase-associated EpsI family protein [Chlamydiales bacterium]
MNKNKQILLWSGLTLAVILGLLWQFIPLQDASKRIDELPLYGPSFVGRNIPLSPWEQGFFKNVNVLKRVYRVGGQDLFISALDGTNNRHAVHDPLYCFRGSGWEVVEQKSLPLADGGSVAFVKLRKGKEEQDAMYWFSNGKEHYDAPLKYWWQATLRRLSLGASSQEPILIVIQPIDKSTLDWKQLVNLFPQLLTL